MFAERELAQQPLTRSEISRLTGGNPASLVDQRKPSFKALGVGTKALSDDEAIALMAREPNIIRRPIFDIDGKVIIGFSGKEAAGLDQALKA